MRTLLLFVVTAAVTLTGCVKDDYSVELENDLQAVQKEVMTLQELFQLQLNELDKKIDLVMSTWEDTKTRYTALNVPVSCAFLAGGYVLDNANDLQNALNGLAGAITTLEELTGHASHGNLALDNRLTTLKTNFDQLKDAFDATKAEFIQLKNALLIATDAANVAQLQQNLEEAYDRIMLIQDQWLYDFLAAWKATNGNLNEIDWALIIKEQWKTNNTAIDDNGKRVMAELIKLQVTIDGFDKTLYNLFADMYGDNSADPNSGGVKAKAYWLYKNFNQNFIDAMISDLGLEFDDVDPINENYEFKKVVDIFNELVVIAKGSGDGYTSLLVEALLADFGEVLGGEGTAYFEKFDQFKQDLLVFVMQYKPNGEDQEFGDAWDFYVNFILGGVDPTKDDIWNNICFILYIAKETNFKAYRMWEGLEMRKKWDYDPITLQPTQEADANPDGSYNYQSKLVFDNYLDILRLKSYIEMVQQNIENLYAVVGGWVTELNLLPDYLTPEGVPSVPFRYISDENGSVSGYMRLRYLVSPANVELGWDYFIEKIEVVCTPSTRAAAGEIRIIDADEFWDVDHNELWVGVYVENIKAFEGKNVGFVLSITNENFDQMYYNYDTNAWEPVEDQTVRTFKSEINYAKVEYNEVGIATRKDLTQIDQPIVVRQIGESDADALARAREGAAIEFISTDEFSFNLGEKLIPYVYDPNRPDATKVSLFELFEGIESFGGKTHNQIIPYNGLVKAELLPGEDGKYLVLQGNTLKRKPITGGTDTSFGKFQYIKLTYEFEGWEVPLEKEGKVTRVAYLKLQMTNPAEAALKEFTFSNTLFTNQFEDYVLNQQEGFAEQLGYTWGEFAAIYGAPTLNATSAIFNAARPEVNITPAIPVGAYQGVYTYAAVGYPTVKITWNVTLVLPDLKVHQVKNSLPIDPTAPTWQYQPLKVLFNLNPDTGEIEFNGDWDDYNFVIKKLPEGFRLEAGRILRSNAEFSSIVDKAADYDGKQIVLDGGAKADFWQAVRRQGGFVVDLVAIRGVHETVVKSNVRVNFDDFMTYDAMPAMQVIDNNIASSIIDLTGDFGGILIDWTADGIGTGLPNAWYGVAVAPKFAKTAFIKNTAGEYIKLPQRFMDRLTFNTDSKLTWQGQVTLNVPGEVLDIYLPVIVEHDYGTYSEYYHFQVRNF
ncbi:MAG: hypothetical protein ACOX2D_04000 [Fermentimonas sp.]